MILITNLLISFFCHFCEFGSSFDEPVPSQASIIQRIQPGLTQLSDFAKMTIKE